MIVSCEQCSREFDRKIGALNRYKTHFCSIECAQVFQGKNVFNYFLKKARGHIKRKREARNLEFEITTQDLEEVWKAQNGKCNLTGEILTLGRTNNDFTRTASLDRKDSSIGYIKSNVQWVHKEVNIMKWNFDQNKFLEWCKRVTTHCRMWFY